MTVRASQRTSTAGTSTMSYGTTAASAVVVCSRYSRQLSVASRTGDHRLGVRGRRQQPGQHDRDDDERRHPLGAAAGLNLYAYVGSNPMNMVDTSGLDEMSPTQLRDLSSALIDMNHDTSISDEEYWKASSEFSDIVSGWAELVFVHGPGRYKLGGLAQARVRSFDALERGKPSSIGEALPGVHRTLSVEQEFYANMDTVRDINGLNVWGAVALEISGRDSRPFLRQTAPLTNSALAVGGAYAHADSQPKLSAPARM